MDTEKLRQFVQVVDTGSIQGAARLLGVSRSVVRRSLDDLEAEIGTSLLHRDPSGVRLTAAGSMTLERARPLLESARILLMDARSAEREARGVIRVIEPVGMPMAAHISGILAARAAMPNQHIVVRQVENPLSDLTSPFEIMLHEGSAPDRNAWFSRIIARIPLRLVASRAYIARRGVPQSLLDLPEHETLGWSRPGQLAGEWPLLDGGVVAINPWFVAPDPHLLANLAIQGGGIFLMPDMPFFDSSTKDILQPVLEDQVGGEILFWATTPFPARADPRTRDTVAMLVSLLEGLPQD